MSSAKNRSASMSGKLWPSKQRPPRAKVVDMVRKGAIGDPQLIQATFSFSGTFNPNDRLVSKELAGGGILDVGGYPISLARLIAGASQGKPFSDPTHLSAQGILHPETGIDSYALADLKFENDVLAQTSCGVLLQQQSCARIYGTRGWIEIQSPWNISPNGEDWSFTIYREDSGTEEISGHDERHL